MLTALYDGNCLICQSTCAALRAFDWWHRIRFIDLNDEAGHGLGNGLSRAQLLGEIQVFDEDGRRFAGFQGTRRLLKELPLGFPIWLLLQLPGMDGLGSRVYRYVAARRYRLNARAGKAAVTCGADTCNPPR